MDFSLFTMPQEEGDVNLGRGERPRATAERHKPAIIRPPLLAEAPRGLSKILNPWPAITRSFRSTALGSHLPEKDRRRGQPQPRTRPAILPGRLINNKKLFKTGFSVTLSDATCMAHCAPGVILVCSK